MNATSPVLNHVHRTFIGDVCSTECKRVLRNKRETWSHMKKGKFLQWALRHLKVHFTRFLKSVFLVSKICPLTWMEDSNKTEMSFRFSDGTSPRSPLTLALPRPFLYQSDCFLSYNTMHTGFFCLFFTLKHQLHLPCSNISHARPVNKICLITITNFFDFFFFVTNNKSVWSCKSHRHRWLRPRDSCASIVQQLYTQWWKKKIIIIQA